MCIFYTNDAIDKTKERNKEAIKINVWRITCVFIYLNRCIHVKKHTNIIYLRYIVTELIKNQPKCTGSI